MIASLLSTGVAADAGGTAAAEQSHAAIIFPMLALLVAVICVGVVFALFIGRYLRSRTTPLATRVAKRPGEPLRGAQTFQSSIFHCPNRWLAVKSGNLQVVQSALGLHNPTPCSWTDGMARVGDQKLFVSPPVNGWILVVGSLLPEPGEDVDVCFRFLQRLSRELGEVQFFSVNRAVGHHAWARFETGRATRGYAWAGETLWNQGHKTWAERKLGLTCYDYCEGNSRDQFAQRERGRANTDKILLLASMWSVDPSSIEDNAVTDALGVSGDLSSARPR
jgi:hypothetical protein